MFHQQRDGKGPGIHGHQLWTQQANQTERGVERDVEGWREERGGEKRGEGVERGGERDAEGWRGEGRGVETNPARRATGKDNEVSVVLPSAL